MKTGNVSQPRTVEVRACTACSRSTSHSGNRLSTSSRATRPSVTGRRFSTWCRPTPRSWASAPGQTTNQTAIFALPGAKSYRVSTLLLFPGATGGDPSTAGLRNFELWVSDNTTAPSDFVRVLTARAHEVTVDPYATGNVHINPQVFPFASRLARYVKLVMLDNYGDPDHLEVADVDVYGLPAG